MHTGSGAACHSSKENDAIKVKLRSRDHSSTNSKHACAEGSVTNLKGCYGESADNFLLTYVLRWQLNQRGLEPCVRGNDTHKKNYNDVPTGKDTFGRYNHT
jgi:hypothetical protein